MAKNTSFKRQAHVLQNLADYVADDHEGRYEIVEFSARDAGRFVIVSRAYRPRGLSITYREVWSVGQRGACKLAHRSVG